MLRKAGKKKRFISSFLPAFLRGKSTFILKISVELPQRTLANTSESKEKQALTVLVAVVFLRTSAFL
jgi:hypothetical protein